MRAPDEGHPFLEQHVDCLMSYDFTGLSYTGLVKELEIVDDMRIWRIAEALRRGFPYELIHEITRIDIWFIDKLAILVEMEKELKAVGEGKKRILLQSSLQKQNALSSLIM